MNGPPAGRPPNRSSGTPERADAALAVQQRFTAALHTLVEQIREDRAILATILCGSLSHDTVWEKSDIDLVLVTIDDRKIEGSNLALYSGGVNVHVNLIPRANFRHIVEGSIQNSFAHSLLAKGRLLFTHDDSIAELLARLHQRGGRDARLQQFRAAAGALAPIDKAHKWLVTRGDLDYTALWILYAATPIAQIEVIGAGLIAGREVIPQALALNPALFRIIYTDLLNRPKTMASVRLALDAVDRYMAERAAGLFAPVLEHLEEMGEARSCSDLETYFKRNFDVDGVVTACEYLADRGLIGKASLPARLTRRSTADVQELAFFHLGAPPAPGQ